MAEVHKLEDNNGNVCFVDNKALAFRILSEDSNPFCRCLTMNTKVSAPIESNMILASYDEFLNHFY